MTNIFKRLHTFTQPEVSVYASIYEGDQGNGVDLYFFKGNPSEPKPSEAMAVMEAPFEKEGDHTLLIAKIFDEEQVGTPDTSMVVPFVKTIFNQSEDRTQPFEKRVITCSNKPELVSGSRALDGDAHSYKTRSTSVNYSLHLKHSDSL